MKTYLFNALKLSTLCKEVIPTISYIKKIVPINLSYIQKIVEESIYTNKTAQ